MPRVLETIAALAEEVDRGDLAVRDALRRIQPQQIGASLFEAASPETAPARLVAASAGVARGVLATSIHRAEALVARGLSVLLAVDETEAEDVPLMQELGGVVALASGLTGHAAIVSRALGLPCLLGSARVRSHEGGLWLRDADVAIPPESFVGICGASGAIFLAPFEVRGPIEVLARINAWLDATGAPPLVASVVSEDEKMLAGALGIDARVILGEQPACDPARLSRIAPVWPGPTDEAADPVAPVPVTRVVAARLALSRLANPA